MVMEYYKVVKWLSILSGTQIIVIVRVDLFYLRFQLLGMWVNLFYKVEGVFNFI